MTTDSRKNRILIIDDEPDLRFLLREFLEDGGFEVLEGENGLDGLRVFRGESPDVVICDLRMPEMDGLEVLSAITAENKETPVVVVSGAGIIQDAIEALRRGAWDYLVKPISDMGILLDVIDKVLERSRLLKLQREYRRSLEREVRERTKELRKSRESYREKCEILETLLQHIPMGIYYMGMDGVFLDLNESLARIFGIPRDLLIGRNFREFPALAALDFLGSEETDNPQEIGYCRMQLAEGFRELALQKAVIRESAGSLAGVVGLVQDVTESSRRAREAREREQQLIHADKMISLGILTAGVAHEINNPNHVIMLSMPLVAEAWRAALPILDRHAEESGDFLLGNLPYSILRERLPETIRTVMDGSERIKGIVHEMKDFSRLDTEETQEPADINAILRTALRLVEGKLKKSCRNLRVDPEPSLPTITGNARQLEQVIVNLLLNSADSLPHPEKAIRVTTRYDAAKEEIVLLIEDEGIGIPEENLAHIFDPFFTTKRETGGTGLGLAISQRIIRKHGGDIRLQSARGQGTTILVTLPVSASSGSSRGSS